MAYIKRQRRGQRATGGVGAGGQSAHMLSLATANALLISAIEMIPLRPTSTPVSVSRSGLRPKTDD